ncbi:MAG: hypothetical protein BGO70_03120 [Bacteroidetes bacterium 43-93]|nr:TonB-dependent receptor [Bacteroidota bacterium]OJW98893.1 MAG: hypothetical protein BGO70_03120 [Bacteroidetes bacterium 43-93]
MNLRTAILPVLLLCAQIIQAQPFTISGTFIDNKDKSGLPGVTVTIAPQNDSTGKTGSVSDVDGNYTLTVPVAGKYVFKASYIGYANISRTLDVTGNVAMGQVAMSPASSTLQNVTVEAKQIRGEQLGDTSQFNANAFKTNPDATTEDLLNKMPGISTQDGTLKSNGEDVKQVLVDGKPFFGDDPTTAIKNLPAEVIDKIQVFDKLSDQAQFTGFDDGQSTKTINIVTKQGKNNGQFGKIYAGYGTDNKYLAGGNVNYFKGDTRLSLIAMFNNVNQQNFATDDLLGVVGNSSGQTRGGGGFQRMGGGGPGGRAGRGGPGGGSDIGNFLVGQQGGITTTSSVGLNYSDNWGKKIKVSGSYFFNSTDNVNNTTLRRQYITARDSNLVYNEVSNTDQKNMNHRANLRLEYTIDSSNSIILVPRVSIQNNTLTSALTGNNTLPVDVAYGNTQTNNTANNNGYNFSNNLLYRHKFAKRGRTISLNINTQFNNKTGDGSYQSHSQLPTDTSMLDQQYNLSSNGYTIAPSLNYTDPIGKKSILQANYSPSYTSNKSDKETYDRNPATGTYTDADTLLSNKYNNTYTKQRGGLAYRFNDKKTSFSLGVDAAYATLDGDQTFPQAFTLSKNYTNVLPSAMFNYRFSRTQNLRLMYRTSTDAPSISQLQNVVDVSNPLLLKTGNTDLQQSYTHTLIARYGNTNPKTAHTFFAFAYASLINNYIGNATYIPARDSMVNNVLVGRGSQISLPVNLDGNVNTRTFITYGLPISFIKSNLNLNAGFTYSRTPGLINYAKNLSDNYTVNGGVTISSNISEKIDFTINYTGNYNTVNNTIQTQSNTSYYSQNASLKVNWLPYKGLVLNTNITYTSYAGLTDSYNQNFVLWNASIGYKFLKDRSLEAKIYVYDILNQNRSISRNVTETYIEDSYTNVLKQYFMFNLTYTLRRFKS